MDRGEKRWKRGKRGEREESERRARGEVCLVLGTNAERGLAFSRWVEYLVQSQS